MKFIEQFDLSGKTALVTGSNRGIGKSILLGLAQQGADVIVHCATNLTQAEAVANEARKFGVEANAIAVNLADSDAPRRIRDAVNEYFSQLDILVLNASAQINGPWLETTREAFDLQMTVNVRASMELIRYFLPAMADRRYGRIVTVGSVQQTKPHWKTLVYASTKSAQMSMVRNLAKQYGPHNVTINNLSPGFTATDRTSESMQDTAYMETVVQSIPLRRVGEADECVGATLLLCSDAASYITGIDLVVDGGMHL